MPNVIAFVLAGGEGTRLRPLTQDRAKPAVPFGGRYRIIDFVLSNLVNSGIYKIKVLTQFKSESLNRHLKKGWFISPILDQYIDPVPAQMRTGNTWYQGSADAVFQNMNILNDSHADTVGIFGADHVYRMDIRQMLKVHQKNDADVTVAAIPYNIKEAHSFGIIGVDKHWRMIDFKEKPKRPMPIPGDKSKALVSMGIYIFNAEFLKKAIIKDAANKKSSHDFGKSIIPSVYKKARVMVYDFSRNAYPGMTKDEKGYWRDIGSIDAYWKSSMDLVSVTPVFNLYNHMWPIRTAMDPSPPAKFVFADEQNKRVGTATDSLVSEGCIISGGRISRSVLSPNVRINSYSLVEESILFENVNVGRYAKIRRAVIDKNVDIPPNTVIGYDLKKDRKKYFVSEKGIVIIPKGAKI
ncbi:MAG: glucose-1-phosphate adenylyltransferase [Deltaproteobacteria bacterium CG11_big_fil_rev_8_21_14_0_20_49_13]|nr:MAG: glucose-1-phosphate adenylyltransferase [Deltaproteobacteria bacterium CG11_big_fil_rev_8_21_14_0_20_49_13]